MTTKIAALLVSATTLFCQAQSFEDLNFESATLVATNSSPLGAVEFAPAFPGWDGTVGGVQATYALLNTVFVDSAGISIINSNYTGFGIGGGVLQGHYTAILQSGVGGSGGSTPSAVSLSQTGLVPAGTQSLQFDAYTVFDSSGSFNVTLGGVTLALVVLANYANYTVYGANIASFADETEPLVFTVPAETPHVNDEYLYLDSIEFSSSPIPEPSALALVAAGGMWFAWLRWRRCLRRGKSKGST